MWLERSARDVPEFDVAIAEIKYGELSGLDASLFRGCVDVWRWISRELIRGCAEPSEDSYM